MSTVHKIRDPTTNSLEFEPGKIENVFEKYYKKLHTEPDSADEELIRNFLISLDLPAIGEKTYWKDWIHFITCHIITQCDKNTGTTHKL